MDTPLLDTSAEPGLTPDDPTQPKKPIAPANPYDAILNQQGAQTKSDLQTSLGIAGKRPDPARWAKVTALAQRANLPTAVVDRNYDRLAGAQPEQQTDYDALIAKTPGLATWLQDSDNATIGRHELEPLGRVEQGARAVTPTDHGPNALHRAWSTGYADLGASLWQLGAIYGAPGSTLEQAAEQTAKANRDAKILRDRAPDYVQEYNQAMAVAGNNVNRATKLFHVAQDELHRGEVLDALKMFGSGALSTTGAALDMIRQAASRPKGLLYASLEGLPGSLPALGLAHAGGAEGAAAGATIGGLVGAPTGPGELATIPTGAAAGAAVGSAIGLFTGMAPVSVGADVNAELSRRGYDVTDAASLLSAYRNPQVMAQIRAHAQKSGVTAAAVNALFAAFAGRLSQAAEGANVATRAVAGAGDATVLAGGQAVADVAGQVAGNEKGQPVDVGKSIQTGVNALGFSALEAVQGAGRRALFHSDPARAAVEATHGADDAMRAQTDAAALQSVAGAIHEAPTTVSVPERLKSLLQAATGGDEASKVFFNHADWDSYWQAKDASPAQAAADIMGDGGHAYYEAKASEGQLAIPLADYLTHVAPTDDFAGLLEHARTQPDGMSLAEAHEYLADLPATLKTLSDEATQPPAETAEPAAHPIYDDIYRQLRETEMPRSAADAQARLYDAAFTNLGERADVDPHELYKQYNLQIGRGDAPVTLGDGLSQAAKGSRERVTAAATKLKDGRVFTAPMHFMIDLQLRNEGIDPATETAAEGFVTSQGRFLDRGEADEKFGGNTAEALGLEAPDYDRKKDRAGSKLSADDLFDRDYLLDQRARYHVKKNPGQPLTPELDQQYRRSPKYRKIAEALDELGRMDGGKQYFQSLPEDLKQYVGPVEEETDEARHHTESRQHLRVQVRTPDGKGMVQGTIDPRTHDFHIEGSELPEALRNKGYGYEMYKKLIDEAHARGMRVFSDSALSPDSQRIYAKLAREGYVVTKFPTPGKGTERIDPRTGEAFSLEPIYEVEPPDAGNEFFQSTRPMGATPYENGFYSKAERLINDKLPDRATAEQVRNILKDAKTEEVEWLGIEHFLTGVGDAKISKEALLDHMRASRLNLVELAPTSGIDEHEANIELENRISENARMDMEQNATPIEGQPGRFRYQDPNEEGVTSEGTEAELHAWLREEYFQNGSVDTWMEDIAEEHGLPNLDGGEGTNTYEDYRTPGPSENYREIGFQLPGNDYTGPHFNEEGLLAHARISDRTNADGQHLMHVEEIQSDLHQSGRERGYQGEKPKTSDEHIARLDALIDAKNQALNAYMAADRDVLRVAAEIHVDLFDPTVPPADRLAKEAERDRLQKVKDEASRKVDATQEAVVEFRNKRWDVPDTPLKKTWHEFVFKRMLLEAARLGYDGLSWSTGEDQNARYPGRPKEDQEGMKYFYDKMLPRLGEKLIKGTGAKVEDRQLAGDADDLALRQEMHEAGQGPDEEPTGGIGEPIHQILFTDQLRAKLNNIGFELFQGQDEAVGARGRFRIDSERNAAIDLFKSADRSTFLHESGHFYLEVLRDLENHSVDIKSDMDIIRTWLGAKENAAFTVAQHEQFARGFERYLMENKAPSEAMRGAFYKFRQWLTKIYQSVAHLNVDIPPDVKGVFDRLLASDHEIAAAESLAHLEPLFEDPKAVGMNEDQAARYAKGIADAHQSAEEELTGQMMHELRTEESRAWAAKRAPIERAVRGEVQKSRIYQAMSELSASMQIDRTAAKELLGDAYRGLPPKLTTAEGGVHPDVAAEVLGFKSGRDLLTQLAHAPREADMVQHLTDERMQAQYGDRMTQQEITDAARALVRSDDKRIAVLRTELEHLASHDLATMKGLIKAVTKRIPPTEEVRRNAEAIVKTKSVAEIRPLLAHQYELAAAKSAKMARDLLLKGDVQGAFEAKSKELLTSELVRAARAAQHEVADATKEFKAFFKSDARLAKTRDMDLINAGRALLASVGIGTSDTSAASHLEQLQRYDPQMYDEVRDLVDIAGMANKNYKSLSFEDFSTLREAVGGLWELSRRNQQMLVAGKLMERDFIKRDLQTRLTELATPGPRAGYEKAATTWERTKMHLLGVRAALRRVEHWVDAMDSGKLDGVFRKYLWEPISDATSTYRLAKRDALGQYMDIVKLLHGRMESGPIDAPELGYEFRGKAELLGALLHSGNESNLQKLLRGREWGTMDENGVLDTTKWDAFIKRMQQEGHLGKAEYDYAQAVWDLFDQLKTGAQRAHKEMYGHYFSELTAKPFTTPVGDYRGGYAPAKVDPFIVSDAALRQERDAVLKNDNSFMFPTTGRGFTKSRSEGYAEPLLMDARFVPSHLDAVLRFTHLEPRVKDVGRLLTSKDLQQTLDGFDPTVRGDMLVPWLQRVAQQRIDSPLKGWGGRAADNFFRELRSRSGLQIMAASVTTAAMQVAHFPGAAVKIEPGRLAGALWRFIRAPMESAAAVSEKSDYMKTRETAATMELQKAIDHIMLDPSKYDTVKDFAKEHGYFLTHGVQSVIDHIAWSAAYEQHVEAGLSEREAVHAADAAVRETQGGFAPEDVSRFEASNAFVRMFSMFYSFFNAKANLLTTEFTTTLRDLGLRKGAGRLAYVYTFGFMIPAVMAGFIRQAASGKPLDEDDDGSWDDLLRIFFESQAEMASRAIPIVGPVGMGVYHAFEGGKQADDLSSSPAIKAIEATVRTPHDVYKAIHDKAINSKEIKDVMTMLGLLTGLPIAPLAKPIGYLHDVHTGTAQPSSTADLLRGTITGITGAH